MPASQVSHIKPKAEKMESISIKSYSSKILCNKIRPISDQREHLATKQEDCHPPIPSIKNRQSCSLRPLRSLKDQIAH